VRGGLAGAIVWSWRHGALLNYGDAVAHLHIARRVFDSHQPRFSQLGSVWLPLPHILMLPFVQVYAGGPTGCGRVPSALAYWRRAPESIGWRGAGWRPPPLRLRWPSSRQSQSALPADHGHDRAAVSVRDDLDPVWLVEWRNSTWIAQP
jgi:hypothetical protein